LRTIYIYNEIKNIYLQKAFNINKNNYLTIKIFTNQNINFFINLKNYLLEKTNIIKIITLSGENLLSFPLENIESVSDIFDYISLLYDNYYLIIDNNIINQSSFYHKYNNLQNIEDTNIQIIFT
jgi:hypothetical protein